MLAYNDGHSVLFHCWATFNLVGEISNGEDPSYTPTPYLSSVVESWSDMSNEKEDEDPPYPPSPISHQQLVHIMNKNIRLQCRYTESPWGVGSFPFFRWKFCLFIFTLIVSFIFTSNESYFVYRNINLWNSYETLWLHLYFS